MNKLLLTVAATALLAAAGIPSAVASRWESSWPYDHTPAWQYRPAVDHYPFTGWNDPYPYQGYMDQPYLNNFGFPRPCDTQGLYMVRAHRWWHWF